MFFAKILITIIFFIFSDSTSENVTIIPQTKSITFILGEDGPSEQYYTHATQYYKYDNKNSTDFVISHIKDYNGIMTYLNNHNDCQSWSKINLVVHANPWTGMSIPIKTDGVRVSSHSLLENIMEGEITELEDGIINKETDIYVHGCALGEDEDIAELVALTFGGITNNKPNVHISKDFITFFTTYFDEIYSTEMYQAKPYFAYYKKGYKPGDIRLSRQLQKRNDNASINWRDALSRTEPRWKGDTYYMTFNIPIEWIVTYDSIESRDNATSSEDHEIWLNNQEDLLDEINNMGIDINDFSWDLKSTQYIFEDGLSEPAVVAKGWVTVLCVLK